MYVSGFQFWIEFFMKALIVDDENLAVQRLSALLADLGVDVVASFQNGQQLSSQFDRWTIIDVAFLDIAMPGKSGIDVARDWIRSVDRHPQFIFLTAYEDYAFQAFDLDATDYLLKPVSKARLLRAIRKVQGRIPLQSDNLDCPVFTVKDHLGIHTIPLKDVFYLRAEDKYVRICHKRGAALIEKSLIDAEKEFGDFFIRIHRNALISRYQLIGIKRTLGRRFYVELKDVQETLEISRRHLSDIRNLLAEKGKAGR